MEVTTKGVIALKHLRQDLQENAGEEFPHGIRTELFVLYDVCKSLDLNIFEAREVLGELGWQYVTRQISSPACHAVNWNCVQQIVGVSVGR